MKKGKYYRTMSQARGALVLDTGFDPFLSGGWGRCTKAKLADAGYPVDPEEVKRQEDEREQRERQGRCRECGDPAKERMLCSSHGIGNCPTCGPQYTGLCSEHTPYSRECDNGHRWRSTDAEDRAAGHKCPNCGEYWV